MIAMPTFRDFVGGPWKTACYDHCKPSTRKRVDSTLRTQLLPNFGAMPLDRISRPAVHQWFDRYSQTAPAGANRTLDVLRQICNHAITCGHLAVNPTRGVERNPRARPTRFLSRPEIDRLCSALATHRGRGSGRQQADIIRLLLLTGCRKSEIVNLRWSEVASDALYLAGSKTGPRTVFLNTQAQAILASRPRRGSPYVFPSLDDTSRSRSNELSLWRKVRHDAGIDDVRLHDLRHTFASHAVMKGVPLPVISRLLGHSRARMTLRYAHVSDRETEAAAKRIGTAIDALLGGQGEGTPDCLGTAGSAAELPARKTANGMLTPGCTGNTMSGVMNTVNALELRQSLGKVLDRLERNGEPIVVCRRRTPAAALVSLKDYRERFVDREADQRRRDVVSKLKQLKFESPTNGTTLDILRSLRS